MNLYEASNQWANRPDDERYGSIEEMLNAARAYQQAAVEIELPVHDLQIVDRDGELYLRGTEDGGAELRFSNYAFQQFCSRLRIGKGDRFVTWPAGLLSAMDSECAAYNLNYALQKQGDQALNMLVHVNEGPAGTDAVLRAVMSTKYSRIWNAEICEWLSNLPEGWRVPPARPAREGQRGTRVATQADVLRDQSFGLSVKPGDLISPAGLYLSDRDMFAFLVNEGTGVEIPGGRENLNRGFFVKNSEVGDAKLRFTLFYFSAVCGNHIAWGVSDVREISFVHMGDVKDRGFNALETIQQEAIDSAANDLRMIEAAQTWDIGKSKEEVVEFVYEKRGLLSKANAVKAYDVAEQYSDIHGSPRSAWGYVSGITRISQETTYANEREDIDRAATKILDLVVAKN